MNKINVMAAATIAVLAAVVSMPVFAQPYSTGGGAQTVTPEQIKECKSYGVPEFACTEQTLLAKRRFIAAHKEGAGGFLGDSGVPMFGRSFGEMGAFVAIIGAIFGGVATMFFVRARVGQKVPIQT